MSGITLADFTTLVRRDLKDEDAASYRWTDTVLARHIAHALREYSPARPRESKTAIATVSGSREIALLEPASGTRTMDAGTNTTTVVDAALPSTVDSYYLGAYLFNVTRSAGRLITAYAGATRTITLASAITGQTTGDTYYIELLANLVKVLAVEYPVGKFPPVYQRFGQWGTILTLLGDEVPDGGNCYVYYGKLHVLDAAGSTFDPQDQDVLAQGAAAYALIEYAAYSIDRIATGGQLTAATFQREGERRLREFQKALKRLTSRLRPNTLYKPYRPSYSQTTDWGPV